MRLSVIIPSFNGGEILAEHLPEVCAQLREIPHGVEAIVVDDASTFAADETERIVREVGSPARLVRLAENRGFAAACNRGAAEAEGENLLFLNNDMHPEPGSIARLLQEYEGEREAFALSPVIVNVEEGFVESTNRLLFRRGVFEIDFPGRRGVPAPSATEWRSVSYPCGGAFIVFREAFLKIGGFPEVHAPFYWEDADLGHRARRYGLEIYEIGCARVLHDHARTIGALYTRDEVRRIYERNRLLFTWVHLAGLGAWFSHLLWLLPRTLAGLGRRRPSGAAPLAALRRLPRVLHERRRLARTRSHARELLRRLPRR